MRDVPAKLVPLVGRKRLRVTLRTRELRIALLRRTAALAEIEATIAKAARQVVHSGLLAEALEIRQQLGDPTVIEVHEYDDGEVEELTAGHYAEEIVEHFKATARRAGHPNVAMLEQVARGRATPIEGFVSPCGFARRHRAAVKGGIPPGREGDHRLVRRIEPTADQEFDIVAEGYDAGVRLGEVIEQDMVAVRVSHDQRQTVVAAPSYLERHGQPAHPRELVDYRCIGWRPAPDVAPYKWEFEENGRAFDVAIDPQVATNDMRVMINTALAGGGFTFGLEESFRSHLDRGALVQALADFCPTFQGFFRYYPDRRNHAPNLRAFVDHVRRQVARQPAARA